MNPRLFIAIATTAMALTACNEETDNIGSSLTVESDKLELTTGSYSAYSRSILSGPVYARNYECYFGRVKDPETGAYVKTEFTAQFNMLEDYSLPLENLILGRTEDGKVAADSCEIWLYFDKTGCYGDSLTPVKMNVIELDRPLEDTSVYLSDFNPKDYIRTGGLCKHTAFTTSNLTYSDSIRNLSGYGDIVRIALNDPYTDKNGVTYNNYGTYLIRNYYEHPEYFKNSYAFSHNVCPGFFFEHGDGLGVMSKFVRMELNAYISIMVDDVKYYTSFVTASTPEVLQTNQVTNDEAALNRLIDDESCTYLKTPAGIYTEVTLPVEEISQSHATDSLLSVSITFKRQNSGITDGKYLFDTPSSVLMIPKDSLNSFFFNHTLYDNKTSYMATLSNNNYTFSNIGNLVTQMMQNRTKGLSADPAWTAHNADWNKVVLLPVALIQTKSSDYYGNVSYTTTGIANQMGLYSTKLVGGPANPIKVEVIYAKFKNN